MNTRREFLIGACAAAAWAQTDLPWGGPVLDIHLHLRKEPDSCFDHMEGSGVTKAVLLTRTGEIASAKAEIAKRPGRFVWFASANPGESGGVEALRKAVEAGACGLGEIKNHLTADSPEMQRVYSLAGEMGVPVLVHFQEVQHFENEGNFAVGYRHFDKILKSHPKTMFIGHADFVWANISKYVPADVAYPPGPVKAGGLTDKWLADFPNFYADMSANSGYNGLTRDPAFARDFLARHQDKLLFGCDCTCKDGHGTGGTPILPQLKGKCVARATLQAAKDSCSSAVFRKITWENGTRLLKIPS
jgi:predicted TIM-barrel fold metal-dependent hydrolase